MGTRFTLGVWKPMISGEDAATADPSFRAVAEALGLGMAFQIAIPADRAGRRFIYLSPNCQALNGVPAEAALADSRVLYDMILPEQAEGFRKAEDAAAATGTTFEIEVAMRRPDGEVRWHRIASTPRVLPDGSTLWDGLQVDITERRAAEERRALVMGELAHRAKNGIAVIMSIVGQTARGADSVAAFEALLMARLQAMATSQDLVTATGGRPVELSDVIARALAPFGMARFALDPALDGLSIQGQAPVGLGLLLHEMATNAQKYGALSNADGRVILARAEAAEGRVAFVWREDGGPPVEASQRKGFGTRLLLQALRNQGGQVTFAFEPTGFRAQIECPAAS